MAFLQTAEAGVTRAAGWLGAEKNLGWKTNWWKPVAIGATGAGLGVGALALLRPTYDSGGGTIITQNPSTDPLSSMMNMLMPLMMMGMMIPMMTGMMKSSSTKNSDNNRESSEDED